MAPKREVIEEMFAEARERYTDAVSAYESRDDRAQREIKNAEYYRGRQEMQEAEGEDHQPYNIIRPVVRDATAEMLRHIPNPSVSAGRDDESARNRAELTERFLRSCTVNGVMDLLELESTILWSREQGVSYGKVFWDENAGRVIPPPDTNFDFGDDPERDWTEDEEPEDNKEYDPFGEEVTSADREGEISYEFVPSYEGFPDPQRNWRKWRYFCHRQVMTVSEAEGRWPKDAYGEPSKFDVGDEHYRLFYESESAPGDGFAIGKGNTLCEIVWYWEAANKQYRNGRLIIFSGRVLLYAGRNPLDPVRLPFAPLIGDNRNPTSGGADGIVCDLIPHQDFTNYVVNRQKTLLDNMSIGIWANPIGSGVDKNKLVNRDGGVFNYHKGMMPTRLDTPEVPQSMFAIIPQLQDQANRTSGYSDIARGAESGQVDEQSGRAKAIATENQGRMREPEVMRFKVFMGWVYEQFLLVAKQQYNEGRLIRILGENARWLILEWDPLEMMLDGEIVIDVFGSAPTTEAQRISETLDLAGAGAFSDTPEAERTRKMIGGRFLSASTFDVNEVDRNKARRNITKIRKDPMYQGRADAWDKHDIALEEVNRFRSTEEYENLDPAIGFRIDDYAEMLELWAEAVEMDLARRAAGLPSGLPSAPGSPSAPGGSPPGQPGAESPGDGGAASHPKALGPGHAQVVAADANAAKAAEAM